MLGLLTFAFLSPPPTPNDQFLSHLSLSSLCLMLLVPSLFLANGPYIPRCQESGRDPDFRVTSWGREARLPYTQLTLGSFADSAVLELYQFSSSLSPVTMMVPCRVFIPIQRQGARSSEILNKLSGVCV